jgi:hypothetical protein
LSDDLVLVADVDRELVRWLWPGRIPRGKVTVLDGDPGTGKSTLTLTIAAKVTTGSPFPDGARPERGDVILLSAEDDIGDTIRPRLEAAGADLARCWVLPDVHPEVEPGKELKEPPPPRPPELPADLPLLENLVKSKVAALVIIDPIAAFLSGAVDMHRDQDVRRALAPMVYMAARTGTAVVIVRHMNKGQGTALYRGSGSIGIVGAARSGLLVAPDPDDDSRRILASSKSNLAKEPDALAYRIVEDERYGVARVGVGRDEQAQSERPGPAPGRRGRGGRPGRGRPRAQGDPGGCAIVGRECQEARGPGWCCRADPAPSPPGARRDHSPAGIRSGRRLRLGHARRPTRPHGTRHTRHGCHMPRGRRGWRASVRVRPRRPREVHPMTDEPKRPPAHPLLGGESEFVERASGWPSGLTDREREVLMGGAVGDVMERLGVDEDEARELLNNTSAEGRVSIMGDRRMVGVAINGVLLFHCSRADLRAYCHPEGIPDAWQSPN